MCRQEIKGLCCALSVSDGDPGGLLSVRHCGGVDEDSVRGEYLLVGVARDWKRVTAHARV